ncbi:YceI-like domain-containing protein [Algoriphagus ratkowskyi]|uniref:YceI family protein n=1 Tax=Algoriphagus ratkowskyi TaxID=57028 RepID=A0A2W7SLF7_9BACT|nr:YceI family protein [Algoriphagus ratkowskyi]PZX51522.1 YceI-like domain-containing protein [Algoriphagus ratkowskyi]TXD78805.1 YceI family protein [Algoriphagus ratkowskyi]
MKNNYKHGITLIVYCLFSFGQVVVAQSTYLIDDSKSNDMKLSGTSSLHDWEMNAQAFSGKAQFDLKKDDNQTLVGLSSLTFSLPVTNLKSDKKGLDKNAYQALKTDKHKSIIYTLSSAKVSAEKDHKFLIKTTGNLTISGVTKEVVMNVYCSLNKDSTITCIGTESLKMSDYEVEPPSFLFGAMKTGDAVTLDFIMVYKN